MYGKKTTRKSHGGVVPPRRDKTSFSALPPTNNMFANDGSFMDMFKRTIASNGGGGGGDDGSGAPDAHAMATVEGHTCDTVTSSTKDDGRRRRRSPSEMTSNVRRTLPPGATYAAAATTYVHAGSLIPASSRPRTAPSADDTPRTVEGPMQRADDQSSFGRASVSAVATSTPTEPATKKTSLLPFVRRRRGGKTLPTGMVKKAKTDDATPPGEKGRTDAWSQYMAEVRKYKEMSCEDEGKTRPLVK